MLSKNHWVRPFLVFFKLVREKFFVTVAFDHPVPLPCESQVYSKVHCLEKVFKKSDWQIIAGDSWCAASFAGQTESCYCCENLLAVSPASNICVNLDTLDVNSDSGCYISNQKFRSTTSSRFGPLDPVLWALRSYDPRRYYRYWLNQNSTENLVVLPQADLFSFLRYRHPYFL